MVKYQEIANKIEQYIEDRALQQGDKLPVLETLMTKFEASKSTITKALDLLEKKGIVYQVRGSGIFVRRQNRKGYISLLSNQGFKKDLEDFNITTEVIKLDIRKPTKDGALNLKISPDEDVYYVKRVRYIDGKTLCLEESFFNKSIITYLNKEIVSESIFNYLREGLGLKIGFSDMYLRAGQLDQDEAKYLGLKKGEPKLCVETLFHLTNGEPFDFSKVTYNFKYSQFFIQTNSQFM